MPDELAKRLFDAWPLNDRGGAWHDLYLREQAGYEDMAAEARAYWRERTPTREEIMERVFHIDRWNQEHNPTAQTYFVYADAILALLDSRLGGK
jgi:hypothetical protein